MKRNNLYLIAIGLGLSIATACNNNKSAEDHNDTVVVKETTTQETATPSNNDTTEPSTNVSVDGNGAEVNSGGTDVSVSKDSLSYQKR